MGVMDKLRTLLEPKDKRLQRERVAESVAELFRNMPNCRVVGPNYKEGPLGGQCEQVQLIFDSGPDTMFVTVNIYGRS